MVFEKVTKMIAQQLKADESAITTATQLIWG